MEKIFGISVHTESLQDQMGYDGVILLTYKIDYPQFVSDRFSAAAARLNLYYKAHALAFERYCRKRLFQTAVDVKQYVVRQVTEQIEKQIQNGENYYFDNYEQNVADELNLEDFYLVPLGIMIFFQQYAIAPYSSGMPEFLLPFIRGISMPPHC